MDLPLPATPNAIHSGETNPTQDLLLIDATCAPLAAERHLYQKLLLVPELVCQETILYFADIRNIPDRIGSLLLVWCAGDLRTTSLELFQN